ncbi:MAG: hypothetical protein JWO32_723 [Bacteroidetes bacterium]|nr:hypothetical protein [Bacteroidota bacterium]
MTVEQIKEQLSNGFISILAANKGFAIDKPSLDNGVDFQLKKSYTYVAANGKTRYATDSRYIDLQLKATTDHSIIDEPTLVRYDLEAKTFNDLVERQTNGTAPLILILFVLPHDQNTWVDIDANEIKLRKHAYWYTPPVGSAQTENVASIRIEIPKANILGLDCFIDLHQQCYPSI